ncbi:hypothetical protein [Achromobacter deleyi]|uniref:hypothetical protein n=1 Tax=Achromobacter deleyi TaxID=1353891 RepID=UPI001492CEDB|nr:hypothetical protein [Achromobacter deleyi]QVQ24413.1 hypothetical protein HLG70_16015 [Achromobacter deleyi]UIP19945.1 hypothetical protein LYZ39_23625 [Achromobacter deleyi]
MPQGSFTDTQATRRREPSELRFWYIVLAGTLASLSYEIVSLLQGDFSAAKKLLLPTLLLVWLYRGSEWARWILMILLLGFGVLNIYLGTELLRDAIDRLLYVYVFGAFMVATGLYLALAKKDFARYCSYVAVRNDLRTGARRAAGRS